jgi:hypothetical protein
MQRNVCAAYCVERITCAMSTALRLTQLLRTTPLGALESTVISHDLPYPHNLRLALRLEEIIRDHGATPAAHRSTDRHSAIHAIRVRIRVVLLSWHELHDPRQPRGDWTTRPFASILQPRTEQYFTERSLR